MFQHGSHGLAHGHFKRVVRRLNAPDNLFALVTRSLDEVASLLRIVELGFEFRQIHVAKGLRLEAVGRSGLAGKKSLYEKIAVDSVQNGLTQLRVCHHRIGLGIKDERVDVVDRAAHDVNLAVLTQRLDLIGRYFGDEVEFSGAKTGHTRG